MSRAEIVNETRQRVLHASPEWALTPWQQAKGFMFSSPGERALIFLFMPARRVALHMWFVFGPIDVLALDGTGRVVELRENFRPWSLWRTHGEVSAIAELPAGTISGTGTTVGDRIELPAVTIPKRIRQT